MNDEEHVPCDHGETAWLTNIKKSVISFLQDLNINRDYTFFKYSYSGDLQSPRDGWGLGQLVFAGKILYMLDEVKGLKPEHRDNLIAAIDSFWKTDGFYSDARLVKPSLKVVLGSFLKGRQPQPSYEQIRRAETRQTFAALIALNAKPRAAFMHVPDTQQEISKYLSSLDWTQPWAAGSHFSHLLFFLHHNQALFGTPEDPSSELIDFATEWIGKRQSASDGCWYDDPVRSATEKINGAMKILTGFRAAGKSRFPYPECLINTALTIPNEMEACSNFNVVYVLYCCRSLTDYRHDDIKAYCLQKLSHYKQYYFDDIGGFSFYLNRANQKYYGAKITRGLKEPDIHGTVMFLWGITLISKIIGLDLGLREPVT